MRRSFAGLALVAVSLCLFPGCTAPGRGRTFAMLGGLGWPLKKPGGKADKENPLKEDSSESKLAASQPAAKESKTARADQPVSHDAETLKLIERELADAAPEERRQLLSDLKGVDPIMVRRILRIRRTSRQFVGDAHSADRSGLSGRGDRVGRLGSDGDPGPAGRDQRYAGTAPTNGAIHGAGHSSDQVGDGRIQVKPAGIGIQPWGSPGPESYAIRPAHTQIYAEGRPAYVNPASGAGSSGSPPSGRQSDSSPQGSLPDWPGHIPDGPPRVAEGSSANAMEPGSVPRATITSVVPGEPTASSGGDQGPAQPPGGPPGPSGPPLVVPVSPPHQPPTGPAAGAQQTAAGPLAGSQPPRAVTPSGDSAAPGQEQASLANRQMDPNFPTPQPPASPPADPSQWKDELPRLISMAESVASESAAGNTPDEQRRHVERHVFLRMLYLIAGRQEQALEAIPGIAAADQEFWQQVFWAVANYFHAEAMPNYEDRATQTIAQLRTAIQRLQENARLELRNVAFCHKILNYGSYEPFERDEFRPGQPVLVYAEVSNFKSDPADQGRYRTVLKSWIEIHKAGPDGGLVEKLDFPPTEDFCRNPRRDYFHSYEFAIPKRASLGPHVLKLIVEDQLSRKVATYTLNFTVR